MDQKVQLCSVDTSAEVQCPIFYPDSTCRHWEDHDIYFKPEKVLYSLQHTHRWNGEVLQHGMKEIDIFILQNSVHPWCTGCATKCNCTEFNSSHLLLWLWNVLMYNHNAFVTQIIWPTMSIYSIHLEWNT